MIAAKVPMAGMTMIAMILFIIYTGELHRGDGCAFISLETPPGIV